LPLAETFKLNLTCQINQTKRIMSKIHKSKRCKDFPEVTKAVENEQFDRLFTCGDFHMFLRSLEHPNMEMGTQEEGFMCRLKMLLVVSEKTGNTFNLENISDHKDILFYYLRFFYNNKFGKELSWIFGENFLNILVNYRSDNDVIDEIQYIFDMYSESLYTIRRVFQLHYSCFNSYFVDGVNLRQLLTDYIFDDIRGNVYYNYYNNHYKVPFENLSFSLTDYVEVKRIDEVQFDCVKEFDIFFSIRSNLFSHVRSCCRSTCTFDSESTMHFCCGKSVQDTYYIVQEIDKCSCSNICQRISEYEAKVQCCGYTGHHGFCCYSGIGHDKCDEYCCLHGEKISLYKFREIKKKKTRPVGSTIDSDTKNSIKNSIIVKKKRNKVKKKGVKVDSNEVTSEKVFDNTDIVINNIVGDYDFENDNFNGNSDFMDLVGNKYSFGELKGQVWVFNHNHEMYQQLFKNLNVSSGCISTRKFAVDVLHEYGFKFGDGIHHRDCDECDVLSLQSFKFEGLIFAVVTDIRDIPDRLLINTSGNIVVNTIFNDLYGVEFNYKDKYREINSSLIEEGKTVLIVSSVKYRFHDSSNTIYCLPTLERINERNIHKVWENLSYAVAKDLFVITANNYEFSVLDLTNVLRVMDKIK
jgi:hypothetical protein